MSELSRKVSTEQWPVISTALDRSSGICVHEQACLCSVLFWRRLRGYHEEEQTPSDLISVTLHSTDTMSHSSKCGSRCCCRGRYRHQAYTVILNNVVHLWRRSHRTPVYFHQADCKHVTIIFGSKWRHCL